MLNSWLTFYLFTFGCTDSLLLCTLFSMAASAGYCSLQHTGSHCGGVSCCGAQVLGAWASSAVAAHSVNCGSWALEHRRNSVAHRLSCCLWDLFGSGIEPVSTALVGRFLTTGPPRKSLWLSFKETVKLYSKVSCITLDSQQCLGCQTLFKLVTVVVCSCILRFKSVCLMSDDAEYLFMWSFTIHTSLMRYFYQSILPFFYFLIFFHLFLLVGG